MVKLKIMVKINETVFCFFKVNDSTSFQIQLGLIYKIRFYIFLQYSPQNRRTKLAQEWSPGELHKGVCVLRGKEMDFCKGKDRNCSGTKHAVAICYWQIVIMTSALTFSHLISSQHADYCFSM